MSASSAITKRSLTIAGHRTSISLEGAFWAGLQAIATRRDMTPPALVAQIDRDRGDANLSSAIRLFVLHHLHRPQDGITERSSLSPLPETESGSTGP